jgi:nucleoside-diphosphate-sugar epimerase
MINTNTLRASKENKINSYIYVGTACSFPKHLQMGPGIHALRENETYPAEPESSYGWSKLMGEYEAELNQNNGFRVGLLRLHNVYGPRSDYSPASGQVIPSLIRKANNYPNEDFVVWGSGSQYRDFIFVDDVVNALIRMHEHGMDQGVIQVGYAKAVTIADLASIIAKKVGERNNGVTPPIVFDKTKPEGDRGRIAINDRARDILHWHPATNIETGVDATMTWMSSRASEPRVLVILIGEARGSDYAWKSLDKHFLKPYNAHLATLFTTSSPMTILQEKMAQFVWTVPEYEDWGVVFNLASAECNDAEHLRDWHMLFDIPEQWLGGIRGSGQPASAGILLAFRWLVQKHLIAHGLLDKYDYFVLSRADLLYQCDHESPLKFSEDSLNVPVGENWGGYTDRHLVAPKALFMQAINMTSELVCRPQYWHNILKDIPAVNLEKTLATMWKQLGLKVREYPRSMFAVKLPEDHTRWSKGHQNAVLSKYDGLKVKYESEMKATTCANSLQDEMQQLKEYIVA